MSENNINNLLNYKMNTIISEFDIDNGLYIINKKDKRCENYWKINKNNTIQNIIQLCIKHEINCPIIIKSSYLTFKCDKVNTNKLLDYTQLILEKLKSENFSESCLYMDNNEIKTYSDIYKDYKLEIEIFGFENIFTKMRPVHAIIVRFISPEINNQIQKYKKIREEFTLLKHIKLENKIDAISKLFGIL